MAIGNRKSTIDRPTRYRVVVLTSLRRFWNTIIIIALLEVPTFEDRSPFLRSNYEQVGSVFRDPLLTTNCASIENPESQKKQN